MRSLVFAGALALGALFSFSPTGRLAAQVRAAMSAQPMVKVVPCPEPTQHLQFRRTLVGPGINQPPPYPGYEGFVGWSGCCAHEKRCATRYFFLRLLACVTPNRADPAQCRFCRAVQEIVGRRSLNALCSRFLSQGQSWPAGNSQSGWRKNLGCSPAGLWLYGGITHNQYMCRLHSCLTPICPPSGVPRPLVRWRLAVQVTG